MIDRCIMVADPMIRALHLADLITELNGTSNPSVLSLLQF